MNKSTIIYFVITVLAINGLISIIKKDNSLKKEKNKTMEPIQAKFTGNYKLTKSNSTISIGKEYCLLSLNKGYNSSNGYQNDYEEAVIFDSITKSSIHISNIDLGYICMDTPNNFNEAKFFEILNKIINPSQRRVVGWVKKPIFDTNKKLICLSTEIENIDNKKQYINKMAIILGRNGCEIITSTQPKDIYEKFNNRIDNIINGFKFEPGFNYTDYTSGDKTSEFNIADLLYFIIDNDYKKA